jgi:phosphatidylglycerol:prolipoprotein diacylglycerol transferase
MLSDTAILAFQFTSPGPILVEWGPIVIRWYGLLIASAVLIGATLSQSLAARRRVDPDLLSDLAVWLVIAAIPSARLYYVLFQWQDYAQQPQKIIAIWEGGIAIHGAILGGVIASLIFARLKRVSFWQLADLVAPSLIWGKRSGGGAISSTQKRLVRPLICRGNCSFLAMLSKGADRLPVAHPALRMSNITTPRFSMSHCGT